MPRLTEASSTRSRMVEHAKGRERGWTSWCIADEMRARQPTRCARLALAQAAYGELMVKVYRSSTGRLLEWPDLGPMFDCESCYTPSATDCLTPQTSSVRPTRFRASSQADDVAPQAASRDVSRGAIITQKLAFTVSRENDGVICNGVPELDAESIKHVSKTIGRPCWAVGWV